MELLGFHRISSGEKKKKKGEEILMHQSKSRTPKALERQKLRNRMKEHKESEVKKGAL